MEGGDLLVRIRGHALYSYPFCLTAMSEGVHGSDSIIGFATDHGGREGPTGGMLESIFKITATGLAIGVLLGLSHEVRNARSCQV